jgi:hypothetical protein
MTSKTVTCKPGEMSAATEMAASTAEMATASAEMATASAEMATTSAEMATATSTAGEHRSRREQQNAGYNQTDK